METQNDQRIALTGLLTAVHRVLGARPPELTYEPIPDEEVSVAECMECLSWVVSENPNVQTLHLGEERWPHDVDGLAALIVQIGHELLDAYGYDGDSQDGDLAATYVASSFLNRLAGVEGKLHPLSLAVLRFRAYRLDRDWRTVRPRDADGFREQVRRFERNSVRFEHRIIGFLPTTQHQLQTMLEIPSAEELGVLQEMLHAQQSREGFACTMDDGEFDAAIAAARDRIALRERNREAHRGYIREYLIGLECPNAADVEITFTGDTPPPQPARPLRRVMVMQTGEESFTYYFQGGDDSRLQVPMLISVGCPCGNCDTD